jgi:four helix bundle protein
VLADEIVEHLPKGRGYLSDQLHRAALSISLNIAEGAGEYAIEEKIRFYRMAKRSATECAGILDVCQRLQLVDEQRQIRGRELLIRIVSMLIKMARR